ncbi:MAG TPA: amidohydrolase family protein [Candidatus Acidoferrum sp.]|nr:amidohydrolase family protein [Candidatus Acidoferrum sp.]
MLGVYAREQRVISLEEAVRKMSGYPAARLKIWDRGLLRPGTKADVVVFDPIDKVTAERPGRVIYGPAK